MARLQHEHVTSEGEDMSLLSAISQEPSPRAEFLTDVNVNGDVRADFRKKHAWLLSVPKPIIAAINGPAISKFLAL